MKEEIRNLFEENKKLTAELADVLNSVTVSDMKKFEQQKVEEAE